MKYLLKGQVLHGDGYGKKLGFPTANLEIKEDVEVPLGVYAGYAFWKDKKYPAAIVISRRSSLARPKAEAHIFDFDQDLYGEILKIETIAFIREYQAFPSEEALIKAIESDVKEIKKLVN